MNYTFSHIGIPTTDEKAWDGFYEPGKIHYTDFNKDDFAIEWVKFEADSPMPQLMQTLPHVAYQVDNIEAALVGKELLLPVFSPGEGVRVAFIIHQGAPVEFIEIK
ncbi:MAG: hypothetical protein AAGC88_03480 [Bacteroidota bacterium]